MRTRTVGGSEGPICEGETCINKRERVGDRYVHACRKSLDKKTTLTADGAFCPPIIRHLSRLLFCPDPSFNQMVSPLLESSRNAFSAYFLVLDVTPELPWPPSVNDVAIVVTAALHCGIFYASIMSNAGIKINGNVLDQVNTDADQVTRIRSKPAPVLNLSI